MAMQQDLKPAIEKDLKELEKGSMLLKLKNGKQYQRKYILDPNKMVLRYEGSTKRFRSKEIEVPLASIQEIREGENSFSKNLENVDDVKKCFSVIIGSNHKVLLLMSKSTEMRDRWVRALKHLIALEHQAQQEREYNRWIRDAFNMADKNGDNQVDMEEILKLLKRMNAKMKKKYVQKMFEEANTNKRPNKNGKQTLDFKEFVDFYFKIMKRSELEEIFKKYSQDKFCLEPHELLKFLQQQQKQRHLTEQACEDYIKLYEPDPSLKVHSRLSLLGFQAFMTSEGQQLFRPAHRKVYQDMDLPLTSYFVSASHNTYLEEDQLKGPSCVEAYIRALKRGCRCVELDCWDGPSDDPVVYHGHTLTSKIKFKDVLETIKTYAFVTSEFPLILSLENHCSIKQQGVMAQYIDCILGDAVYSPEEDTSKIPSPNDLKNKFILKGKKLPAVHVEDDVSDEDEAAEIHEVAKNIRNENQSKKLKLDTKFSSLIGCKSQQFKGIDHALNNADQFKMTSIGENKILKLISQDPQRCMEMTKVIMIRTYPAGTRTDSSNYHATPMWNVGCQVVALNFQTDGVQMQVYHGKFLDNNNCGYVLKPEFLRSGSESEEPTIEKKLLKIKVISAYQLPKPKESQKGEIIDPFIKIEIHGAVEDCQEQKTKVIKNNGFNPKWNEVFEFSINQPDLCVVRFSIRDSDLNSDDFIGYYALPFKSMQEGFRQFLLFDKSGGIMHKSVVLVHVDISSVV